MTPEKRGMMLRRARKNAKLTREAMGPRVGLSVRTIAKVEAGEGGKMETVIAMARFLGLSPRVVLGL